MPRFLARVASVQSRDHFYLPASAQNLEDSEELLKAEESRLICRKQKKKNSNFRRRKSNRIYNLLLLEQNFWLKSHPPIITEKSPSSRFGFQKRLLKITQALLILNPCPAELKIFPF